jgi:putative solute:sodium symporter small subunit
LEETPAPVVRGDRLLRETTQGHCGANRPQGVAQSGGLDHMESKDEAYWSDTSRLMWIHLGVWIFFGYIVHMFVNVLNKVTIIGFPLGFYMAAQGSLIVFVVMLFLFARQQDAIDRKHGVAEED